ncbi:MAG: hypothetical protein EU542_09400, partial [Promethearchaeota archaeon]
MYLKKNNKKIFTAAILLLIITLNVSLQFAWLNNGIFDSINHKDQNNIHTSETDYDTKEWITNGDFSSGATNWTSEIGGDISDFNLDISSGEANYKVVGDQRTFSLNEDPLNGSNWSPVPNPDFPGVVDSNYSDSEGIHANHTFTDEGDANQNPSIHWDNNCSMPVNMIDYEITSASLQTVINATVSLDVDVEGDTYSTDTGHNLLQTQSYDYVRFYVLLSDLSKDKIYELGYYQPSDLGAGNPYPTPGNDTLSDTNLITVSEEVLIFYLSSVLSSDNFNFTVTLGIRIYAADSSTTYDTDTFTDLLFKSINLTFTYEKKINQLNTGSWKQDANRIPNNYIIENATLNFQYKTDLDWISNTGSLNSEFRIIINNNQLGETVKLS